MIFQLLIIYLHKRWNCRKWRAWRSARVVALHEGGPGFNSRQLEHLFSFSMQLYKGEDNLKFIMPNLSYSNNLIKIRVVLGVRRYAESKFNLYFVLSLFLKEVLVILCWNPRPLFQVSETRHVFGRNQAVRFRRIMPFSQTIKMQQILDSFEKKNRKKNKQWFWGQNQNLKYSIVLKQSISKPAFRI